MEIPNVQLLPLSCQYLSREFVFILDVGWALLLFISVHAPPSFFHEILGKCYTPVASMEVIMVDKLSELN